jgi:hypothetical protein
VACSASDHHFHPLCDRASLWCHLPLLLVVCWHCCCHDHFFSVRSVLILKNRRIILIN